MNTAKQIIESRLVLARSNADYRRQKAIELANTVKSQMDDFLHCLETTHYDGLGVHYVTYDMLQTALGECMEAARLVEWLTNMKDDVNEND